MSSRRACPSSVISHRTLKNQWVTQFSSRCQSCVVGLSLLGHPTIESVNQANITGRRNRDPSTARHLASMAGLFSSRGIRIGSNTEGELVNYSRQFFPNTSRAIRGVMLSSLLVMAACSGKTDSPKSEAAASGMGMGDSSGAADLGKATFSALIDGEPVSGGAIDGMQQQNAAHTIPAGDNKPAYLIFYLFDSKVPDDPNFKHSFRLYVPKQLGSASDGHLTLNIILDADHVARYSTSTPSITISNLSATRVSGTFSGKMTVSPDTPNVPKQQVNVTEGKFDIPMATSNIIPP